MAKLLELDGMNKEKREKLSIKSNVILLPRDTTMDIMKALGILAVVSGHAWSGTSLAPYPPYSFHMPLFFFISGYFFKEDIAIHIKKILTKNIIHLILPTLIFTFFYALISIVLYLFEFKFLNPEITIANLFVNPILASGAFDFNSAYWFIACLFFVKIYFEVVHRYIFFIIRKYIDINLLFLHILFILIYFIIAYCSVSMSINMFTNSLISDFRIFFLRILFALFFYYIGFLFRTYNAGRYLNNLWVIFILFIIAQQILASGIKIDFWVQIMKFETHIFPFVTSLNAIVFFYIISSILSKHSASSILVIIGQNSFPILLHHLFGFFILNILLVILGIVRIDEITSIYYQWNTVNTWYLYIVFGLAVSFIMHRYSNIIKILFLSYIEKLSISVLIKNYFLQKFKKR